MKVNGREGRNYDKGDISGSGRSTYGYILTYPRLLKVKGSIGQLWGLNKENLNFCGTVTNNSGLAYRNETEKPTVLKT